MDPVEHILPLSTIILCVRLSHLEVAGGARRIGWLAFSLDDGETELWCHCPSTLSIEQQNADQLGPIGMILSTFFQFYPIWIWCQEKLLRVNVWEIYFFGAAEDPRVDFGPADGTTLLAVDVWPIYMQWLKKWQYTLTAGPFWGRCMWNRINWSLLESSAKVLDFGPADPTTLVMHVYTCRATH